MASIICDGVHLIFGWSRCWWRSMAVVESHPCFIQLVWFDWGMSWSFFRALRAGDDFADGSNCYYPLEGDARWGLWLSLLLWPTDFNQPTKAISLSLSLLCSYLYLMCIGTGWVLELLPIHFPRAHPSIHPSKYEIDPTKAEAQGPPTEGELIIYERWPMWKLLVCMSLYPSSLQYVHILFNGKKKHHIQSQEKKNEKESDSPSVLPHLQLGFTKVKEIAPSSLI